MSCGRKAIWMQGMFGAFKVKFLKIQNSFIGKLKMKELLFLKILLVSCLTNEINSELFNPLPGPSMKAI
jgi:hypothetical protein